MKYRIEKVYDKATLCSVDEMSDNFTVYEKTIGYAEQITFAVGTTGFCGGNSDEGGRTYVGVSAEKNSDLEVRVIPRANHKNSIEFIVGGDDGLYAIVEGLHFITKTLEEHLSDSNRGGWGWTK